MNADNLRDWVRLTEQKREVEAELREINGQLSALETVLLDQFADGGMQSVTAHGYTVYLQRELSCGLAEAVDKETAIKALEDAGLGSCLMLSAGSLKSLVREHMEAGEDVLPAELKGLIKVSEFYRVRTRKQ